MRRVSQIIKPHLRAKLKDIARDRPPILSRQGLSDVSLLPNPLLRIGLHAKLWNPIALVRVHLAKSLAANRFAIFYPYILPPNIAKLLARNAVKALFPYQLLKSYLAKHCPPGQAACQE